MEDPSFTHLESERLVVRRFRAGDADLLAAYRSDPDVARYQGWEAPYATREADVDGLVEEIRRVGAELAAEAGGDDPGSTDHPSTGSG